MDKLKKVKIPESVLVNINNYKTKYDEYFEQRIISRGTFYYNINKVIEFKYNNDICDAIVKGSRDYNVKIRFKKDKLDALYCSCPYHESSTYCKHIYAVLVYMKVEPEKEGLIKMYKDNYSRIEKILDDIKKITDDNEEYLFFLSKSWAKNLPKFYERYLKELRENYDEKDIIKLISSLKDSYFFFNDIIEDYNNLIDEIEKGKKEAVDLELKKEKDIISTTYIFDESGILEYADELLANTDASQLKRVKRQLEKSGEDTSIIDKALKERTRRDKKIKEKEKQQRKSLFWKIISGLFSQSSEESNKTDLMTWEQEEVDKGNYGPYQFEEEELEEDDFYNDDLD